MKILSITILLTFTTPLYGKIKNPYLSLEYDKVIMYDFSGGDGETFTAYPLNDKGQLSSAVAKQVQLDRETIKKLNIRLGKKNSYGAVKAFCFEPHLGFAYYSKNKTVAYISICLYCNVLRSSLPIDAQKQGKNGSEKNVYYILDGPSKSFRLFLNDLLRKNHFSHQIRD